MLNVSRISIEIADQTDEFLIPTVVLDESLKALKNRIRALEREARQAVSEVEVFQKRKEIDKLEKEKRKLRQNIFTLEDSIKEERDRLMEILSSRMEKRISSKTLFDLEWHIV